MVEVQVSVNGQDIRFGGNEPDSNSGHHEGKTPIQCPHCGDTIKGLSKICPSCSYIPDRAAMEDCMKELQRLIGELSITKKTWGKDYENLLTAVGYQMIAARSYYGENPEIKATLEKYADEKEALVKKGKAHMVRSGLISGGVSIIIIVSAIFLYKLILANN